MLIDKVAALLSEVAQCAIVPRFRPDGSGSFDEKTPGEVVTPADIEAERLLSKGLALLKPGIPIIGEESCDAAALQRFYASPPSTFWLVDPLDGTANFAAGSPTYATMVALVESGLVTQSWIYQPATATMFVAEKGSGAFSNGEPIRTPHGNVEPSDMCGAILTRFLEPEMRGRLMEKAARFAQILPGLHCSGFEYPMLARGEQHFAMFWRALPWDHAPGALLLSEAGGRATRMDDTEYEPAEDRRGLLAASSFRIHRTVLQILGDTVGQPKTS